MSGPTIEQVARTLADLRLQCDALDKATKATSLPEAVARMRSTIKWSAVIVALALIVSSLVRMYQDTSVHRLERRIEELERQRGLSDAPPM